MRINFLSMYLVVLSSQNKKASFSKMHQFSAIRNEALKGNKAKCKGLKVLTLLKYKQSRRSSPFICLPPAYVKSRMLFKTLIFC